MLVTPCYLPRHSAVLCASSRHSGCKRTEPETGAVGGSAPQTVETAFFGPDEALTGYSPSRKTGVQNRWTSTARCHLLLGQDREVDGHIYAEFEPLKSYLNHDDRRFLSNSRKAGKT